MVNKKTYKDSLFKFIFGRAENKHHLMSLYNALTGSNCTDESELEITTIEDIIYITRKNDISFMIGDEMYLLEQQSTFNPNMPLRGLMYFSQLYSKHVTKIDRDLFGTTLIKIPAPVFYVFYNGTAKKKDREVLRLSDAFDRKVEGFEWTAIMLNVNYGHNKKLLSECKGLQDYATYVKILRTKQKEGLGDVRAVNETVNEAIRLNLLDGFFKIHKAEVLELSLTEFNQEEYDRHRRAEGREEMQPIIDRKDAEIARQAAELAEKDRIIAELQSQITAKA